MTFPEHIANAPTPRTDAINIEGSAAHCVSQYAKHAEQLERQLIWAEEQLKEASEIIDNTLDGNKNWSRMEKFLSVLNEYKQGTKV